MPLTLGLAALLTRAQPCCSKHGCNHLVTISEQWADASVIVIMDLLRRDMLPDDPPS